MQPWVKTMDPSEPPIVKKKLVVDKIVNEKLSDLLSNIESILQPYQTETRIGIEKKNEKVAKLVIAIEVKL